MGRDILVEPLSASQWRVLDPRLPENDARSLLGYIEVKDSQFEVTQLTHGFHWFHFDSFRAATDHFSGALTDPNAPDDHVLSWMNATA